MVRQFIDRIVCAEGLAVSVFIICAAMIGRTAYLQVAMGWMSVWASYLIAIAMLAVLVIGLYSAVRWSGPED